MKNQHDLSPTLQTKNFVLFDEYIEMPDGVKIAVDAFVPKKSKNKVPAILYFTRYTRSFDVKPPFNTFIKIFYGSIKKKEINHFTKNGYAVVTVDLRGSGSSTGYRTMEFSHQEIDDMSRVIDWVIQQPWSNGKVATSGVSYAGTTAEFALSTKHPAIKACVPRSGLFDLYTDVNFPGGIRQAPFIDIWQKSVSGLDNWNYSIFNKVAPYVLKSAKKVKKDKNGEILMQAKNDHANNFDVFKGIKSIKARNEIAEGVGYTNDDFSVHQRLSLIKGTDVPIYRITGWYDGAFVNASIKGYLNTPEYSQLLIGPWDHGPYENISPFKKSNKLDYDVLSEITRFLDYHVKGEQNGFNTKDKVRYFMMGKEEFIKSTQWPDPKTRQQVFYIDQKNLMLQNYPSSTNGKVDYTCDYSINSGKSVRWNSQTPAYRKGKITYGNRYKINQKMLVFDSSVLEEDLQISGHPIIRLYMSFDATDAHVFVYLEDVSKDGKKVTYITEGMLGARHRKTQPQENSPYEFPVPYRSFMLEDMEPVIPGEVMHLEFDFLPIAYKVKKGHKLRLSIAASDVEHFDHPEDKPSRFQVFFGDKNPSSIILPLV